MNIREIAKKHLGGKLGSVVSTIYNRLPFNNRFSICGKENRLLLAGSFLKRSRIVIRGRGNVIDFARGGY